jgi:hypothetical protein
MAFIGQKAIQPFVLSYRLGVPSLSSICSKYSSSPGEELELSMLFHPIPKQWDPFLNEKLINNFKLKPSFLQDDNNNNNNNKKDLNLHNSQSELVEGNQQVSNPLYITKKKRSIWDDEPDWMSRKDMESQDPESIAIAARKRFQHLSIL